MAVTVTNLIFNERGLAFRFVGDGSTTALPAVTYPGFIRPSTTAAVFLDTAVTNYAHGRSGRTGLQSGAGTPAAASVAQAGKVFTVTTGAAVGNGVSASVEIVFNQMSFN